MSILTNKRRRSMALRPDREHLLSSVEMARFVAHGSLTLPAVVPDELNAQAIDALSVGIPAVPYGTPLSQAYPPDSLPSRLLAVPQVSGELRNLVGPEPARDHHAVHIREPHEGTAQALHGDAIIDVRTDAFDVQLMYYPHDVTLDMGG